MCGRGEGGAASYTPDTPYSFNPGGGPVAIERLAMGIYTVAFDGFGTLGEDGGNVQVTAYGEEARHCKVDSWSGDLVGVRIPPAAGSTSRPRRPASTRWSSRG